MASVHKDWQVRFKTHFIIGAKRMKMQPISVPTENKKWFKLFYTIRLSYFENVLTIINMNVLNEIALKK